MSVFPKLKTGAVCQYPAQFSLTWDTHVTMFLDGSEQRYTRASSPVHRWSIRLDLLDEEEALKLQQFFFEQAGRYGVFEFQDPLTGQVFPTCSFESDDDAIYQRGETRYTVTLSIRTVV